MGFKRVFNGTEVGLVASHLPNRKNPVLLAIVDNETRVIASFKGEEGVDVFDKMLPLLVFGEEVKADAISFNPPTHEGYAERCNHTQTEGVYDE